MKKKQQIEADIKSLIEKGVLSPGDRLPSVRELSQRYGVSITPVNDAYSELIDSGWVESRPRSGYYVAVPPVNSELEQVHRRQYLNTAERYRLIDDFIAGYSSVAFNARNNISVPFGATAASTSIYPCEDFNLYHANVLRRLSFQGNFQTMAHDRIELKREIVKWSAGREFLGAPESVSLTRGVTDGIMLSLRACASPGSCIAVEAPGHAGFYFIARFFDYRIAAVPSDPKTGLDVGRFEKQLENGLRPACLILCSNFSNPTGALMPPENKQRLALLCAKHGVPIIEDDICGDLYFSDERPMPIKYYDPENVIYVSGFGKSLNPDVRLGYISGGKYSDSIAFYKHLTVSYVQLSVQLAYAEYLRSGPALKALSFRRRRFQEILTSCSRLISDCFPDGTAADVPAGGIYLWVTLPKGCNSERLSQFAGEHGISIAPGHLFNAPEKMNSCFRINCAAAPWDAKAEEAVIRLGAIARRMSQTK